MKRLIKWFILKLKNTRLRLSVFRTKPEHYKVSIFKRIKMKLKGFTPDNYHQYNFKENNPKDYLTEIDRWKTRRVNGNYNILLDDILAFYHLFKDHVRVPKIYGWIKNRKIYDIDNGKLLSDQNLINIIKNENKLILKPNYGGGGKGVYVIERLNDDIIIINEEEVTIENISNELLKLDNYTISEFINPKEVVNNIYNKTINTIRVITIINKEGEVEIPNAIQRFGTNESIPVDNAASGGIFSKVNILTGELSEAKSYRTTKTFKTHPDSKKPIKGEFVGNWNNIKKEVKKVASKFPYISFMAWDIVPIDESFYVLEINASTAFTLIQMFEPLKHTKLANFYRQSGVIK